MIATAAHPAWAASYLVGETPERWVPRPDWEAGVGDHYTIRKSVGGPQVTPFGSMTPFGPGIQDLTARSLRDSTTRSLRDLATQSLRDSTTRSLRDSGTRHRRQPLRGFLQASSLRGSHRATSDPLRKLFAGNPVTAAGGGALPIGNETRGRRRSHTHS